MVDLDVVFVLVNRVRAESAEVGERRIHLGRGIEVLHLERHRIQPRRGDDVSGKRIAHDRVPHQHSRLRIENLVGQYLPSHGIDIGLNGAEKTREIAFPECRDRHRQIGERGRLPLPRELHVEKEECLVLDHRAAYGAPELVAPHHGARMAEEVSRIEFVVAKKLESRPVKADWCPIWWWTSSPPRWLRRTRPKSCW